MDVILLLPFTYVTLSLGFTLAYRKEYSYISFEHSLQYLTRSCTRIPEFMKDRTSTIEVA